MVHGREKEPVHLLVASATALHHVNTRNYDVTVLLPFAAGIPHHGHGCEPPTGMGLARSVSFAAECADVVDSYSGGVKPPSVVYCSVCAAFEPLMAVWAFPAAARETDHRDHDRRGIEHREPGPSGREREQHKRETERRQTSLLKPQARSSAATWGGVTKTRRWGAGDVVVGAPSRGEIPRTISRIVDMPDVYTCRIIPKTSI